MYKIVEGDFANQQFPNEDYLINWPILYILENGRQAYIGESNHAKQRRAEHKRKKRKRYLKKFILFILQNLISLLHSITKQN